MTAAPDAAAAARGEDPNRDGGHDPETIRFVREVLEGYIPHDDQLDEAARGLLDRITAADGLGPVGPVSGVDALAAAAPEPAVAPPKPCPPSLRGTDPRVVRDEVLGFITRSITDRPRDRQKEIGPSGLGIPCDRQIGYMMADHGPVGFQRPPWRQTIGTCVDDHFKRWAETANDQPWEDAVSAFTSIVGANDDEAVARFLSNLDQADADGGQRWWTDLPAYPGDLWPDNPPGQRRPIIGNLDLYDAATAGVIDVKCPGATQMRKHKAGPKITDQQYRVQVHTYGKGVRFFGWPVDWVGVLRLPIPGELGEATFQWEPYDESVVVERLNHVGAIARMVDALGAAALPMLPTFDHYCRRCTYYDPTSTDPRVACPGHPGHDKGFDPTAAKGPGGSRSADFSDLT